MSFGQRFIETLKIIKYPDVDKLKPASFDWLIEDPRISHLVESFCTCITEENVLTDEELKEYEAILADKTVDLSVLEKLFELHGHESSDKEKQEQIEDLQNQIKNAKEHIAELGRQRDLINVHKLELIQDAEAYEAHDREVQREKQKIKLECLPACILELKAVVESGVPIIKDLHAVLKTPRESTIQVPPVMFLQNLNHYFSSEEKLLEDFRNHVRNICSKLTLEFSSDKINESFVGFFPLSVLEENQKKIITETVRLEMKLIEVEEQNVDAILEEEKLKAMKIFCNDWKSKGGMKAYESMPKAVYRAELETAQKTIRKLEVNQQRLREQIIQKIRDQIKHEREKVILSLCKEKCSYYDTVVKELQKPVDVLFEQRKRLELLNLILTEEQEQMSCILRDVQAFRERIESEDAEIKKAKCVLEEKGKEEQWLPNFVEEGSVLYAVHRILSKYSDPELAYVTEGDVLRKINEKREEKDKLLEESEKLLQSISSSVSVIKKRNDELKDLFYGKSKDSFSFLEDLSYQVRKVEDKTQSLDEMLLKEIANYQKKKKLIETDSHMKKSRKLFIYYVTDKEKYQRTLVELKELEKLHSKYRDFAFVSL